MLAQEENAGEPITGIVTADNSLVTAGPDFAYEVIGKLALNSSVTVVGRRGVFRSSWDGRQWTEIVYGEGTAWVYGRLIRTSVPFNAIPLTGMALPRDRNGRVPEIFDLSSNICGRWQGGFTQSGNFAAGDSEIVVTYPGMEGATVYSVAVFSPSGYRVDYDSETTTAVITRDRLPRESGTYTWQVAPYWTNDVPRWTWQQICLLRIGGTFEIPEPAEGE